MKRIDFFCVVLRKIFENVLSNEQIKPSNGESRWLEAGEKERKKERKKGRKKERGDTQKE